MITAGINLNEKIDPKTSLIKNNFNDEQDWDYYYGLKEFELKRTDV